jgi:hypothetical protein
MPVKTKYFSPARPLLSGLLALLLALGLAACGAENTPTPVAATPTANPAANVSGGTYSDGKLDLPGTTLLTIDPGVETALKGLLGSGVNPANMTLQIYGSDSETPVLGENADSALVKAGYVFHDARQGGTASKLIVNNNEGAGAYTKAGGPDLIVYAREATALTAGGTPPGVDTTQYQKLITQLQGKKSVLIVLSGQNLFQAEAAANVITPTAPPTR